MRQEDNRLDLDQRLVQVVELLKSVLLDLHVSTLGGLLVAGGGIVREVVRLAIEAAVEERVQEYVGPSRPCSRCGSQQVHTGYQPLTIRTLFGPIRVRRTRYWCECGTTWLSGGEFLKTRKKGWSDDLLEAVTLLGAISGPFAKACDLLRRLTGLEVVPKQMDRLTTEVGAAAVSERDAEAKQPDRIQPRPGAAPRRMVVQMDGTMVNTLDGWKETKAAIIYEAPPMAPANVVALPGPAAGSPVKAVPRVRRDLTGCRFLAHVGTAEELEDLLVAPMVQEGVYRARDVAVLGDGAEWIWNRADALLPRAVQILDWFHLSEKLWECGRAVWGPGTKACTEWVKGRETELWEGLVDDALGRLGELKPRTPEAVEAVAKLRGYIEHNRRRLDYPAFRAAGWEIGSGAIESTHKRLVAARLKQAGMRWAIPTAEAILELRCRYYSGSWDGLWKKAA